MSPDMRRALNERRGLIERRAAALVEQAFEEPADWVQRLLPERKDEKTLTGWRRRARVVAAYRDRYEVTGGDPLGPVPERSAQIIDYARARAAVKQLRTLAEQPQHREPHRHVDRSRGF